MSLISVSREQFLARYDKKKTRDMIRVAWIAWDRFLNHIHVEEPTIILRFRDNEKERYAVLDHMIQTWKRTKSLATMKSYFQYVKSWLKYNDVLFDDDKIKELIRFPKPIKSRGRGIDRDIIKRLVDASNPFYRALIIVLVSTGIRINGVLNMTPAWIDFQSRPAKVTVPGEYAKAGIEYITFLTTEAEKVVREIMEQRKLKENDIIFNRSYNAFACYISELRKKLNLLEMEPNGKFHVVRIHKYRSFTLNRLSRGVGSEFGHAMLGHGESVGKYFHDGMSDDEAARDFQQAINHLTINDEIRLQDENQKLKDQVTKQDILEEKVAKLEAALYAKKLKDVRVSH